MSQSPAGIEPSRGTDQYTKAWSATNLLVRHGRSFSGHEPHCCFLNTGAARFADVSAATGLNLPEDGRSLAIVDWDQDGDLDLWLTNRTAPRVRFFRNDCPDEYHFVKLSLVGRSSNRDAIGARVELYLKSAEPAKRIKTLRAGDGFLGQSTKWVHFGLGTHDAIDRLVVHWPGGKAEPFHDIEVDRHYRLVQGEGRVRTWSPPREPVRLTASALQVPAPTETARIVLVGRVPLPDATFHEWQGNAVSLVGSQRGPLLVNMWASWCRPCLEELHEFARHRDTLQSKGLGILALSVDGLSAESSSEAGRRIIERLRFPFASGSATAELVNALDIVQQTVLDRKRPLLVPSSFLVDAEGQITIIYKGPVGIEQLIKDLPLLDAEPATLRNAATPLPGRWFSPPAAFDPMLIAGALKDHGFVDLAGRYAEQVERYFTQGAGGRYVRDSTKADKLASVRAFRGALLLEKKQYNSAADTHGHALELKPDDRPSLVKRGEALAKLGMTHEAALHFSQALAIDPADADTHYNLAIALTGIGRHVEAVSHYGDVLRLRPAWPPAANNLAWILSTHPDDSIRDGTRALPLARQVCEKVHYRDPTGLDTLAAALAELGRFEEAGRTITQAIELAEAQQDSALVEKLRQRLQLYASSRPFRDPALGPAPNAGTPGTD